MRAGQNDPDLAARLVTVLLDADVGRWRAVGEIAAPQGGAAAAALELLASRAETPLPLDELSAALPFSSVGLFRLAMIVDERRLDRARVAGAEPATRAELLVRVSARAADTGDRDTALGSITEAVDHYRRLAQVNPAAYLPDLATSLNNLSNQQSDTGDRNGALGSITEAVDHCRRLAQVNPAAYLPDLATSLNNLSDCLADTDSSARGWNAVIDSLEHPAARAELRTGWARRLHTVGESAQARDQLGIAAAEADRPLGASPDRAAVVFTMRARQAVRSLAQELGPAGDLPVWAAADIPEAHVDLVNAYARVANWAAEQAALDAQREIFVSPGFRTTLQALAALYPANPVPGQLLALLDEIDEAGIDAVFARRLADHHRRALLDAWIGTPTWTESRDFLRQHQSALTEEESIEILASAEDDTSRQHLAILDLTSVLPDERVYQLVTDAAAAEDAALDASRPVSSPC